MAPLPVDGFIARGECAGAGKITFPGYGGEVEVFPRQDADTLYVAFELPDKVNRPPGAASGGRTGIHC
ncbi:MAG TPA: hypothetical protein G4O00_00060 [Thermoflexia bacterium]|jgi:hypothetical protein|nr:hypothetical protein [Thermoflexia bacterium]